MFLNKVMQKDKIFKIFLSYQNNKVITVMNLKKTRLGVPRSFKDALEQILLVVAIAYYWKLNSILVCYDLLLIKNEQELSLD